MLVARATNRMTRLAGVFGVRTGSVGTTRRVDDGETDSRPTGSDNVERSPLMDWLGRVPCASLLAPFTVLRGAFLPAVVSVTFSSALAASFAAFLAAFLGLPLLILRLAALDATSGR